MSKEEKGVEEEKPLEEVKRDLMRIYGDEIDEDEEILDYRVYVIPLRNAYRAPRKKRTPRAVRLIREFVKRHVKPFKRVGGDQEKVVDIYISQRLNELLWKRSIEKPPRRIRVLTIITVPPEEDEETYRLIKVFPVIEEWEKKSKA